MDTDAASLLRPDNSVDMLAALRVVAWVSVFCTHVVCVTPAVLQSLTLLGHNVSWLLLTPAWGGVWIFFTLSGYLIGRSFHLGRYGLSKPDILDFWWRRCVRIMPLYYFVYVIVIVFVCPQLFQVQNWSSMLRMLTFTYNCTLPLNPDGPTWFVSTLMQFYLVAPLLFFCLRPLLRSRRNAAVAIAAALLIGVELRYAPILIFHDRTNPFAHWLPLIYTPIWANLDLFAVGMLANAFTADRAATRPERGDRAGAKLKTVAVAGMVVVWLATSYVANAGLNDHRATFGLPFVVAFPGLFAALALIWIVAFADHRKRVPLSWAMIKLNPRRSVEAFAALTYGVFLWHSPILVRLSTVLSWGGPLPTYAIRFVLGLVLSLTFATVTYFMIERPCRNYLSGTAASYPVTIMGRASPPERTTPG